MDAPSSDLGGWAAPVARFAELAELGNLHGLLFQHLDLCRRRAWLHLNRIDYGHLEPRMSLGSVSHDLHKVRDRSVEGLMGLAPDRIDWDRREVIEAKGSAGARQAVSCQTAFYAIMLMAVSGRRWAASNEIIGKKKRLPVKIDLQVIERMVDLAEELLELCRQETPPLADHKPICNSCSYRHLCGYG